MITCIYDHYQRNDTQRKFSILYFPFWMKFSSFFSCKHLRKCSDGFEVVWGNLSFARWLASCFHLTFVLLSKFGVPFLSHLVDWQKEGIVEELNQVSYYWNHFSNQATFQKIAEPFSYTLIPCFCPSHLPSGNYARSTL